MPRRLPARRQMVRGARQGGRDPAADGRDFIDHVEELFQDQVSASSGR